MHPVPISALRVAGTHCGLGRECGTARHHGRLRADRSSGSAIREGAIGLAKQEAQRGARGEVKAFAGDTRTGAEKALKAVQQLQKAAAGNRR